MGETAMNKKKEIEIIAQTLKYRCRRVNHHCDDCKYGYGEDGDYCDNYKRAELLYEMGVRLADEVRKETAKEILLFLKGNITDGLLKNHEILNALIEHYGVKVDQ